MHKKIILLVGILLFVLALIFGWLKFRDVFREDNSSYNSPDNQAAKLAENEQQPVQATPEFDKQKYSTDEPGSPWWVVNKRRPLPEGYTPSDLLYPNVRRRLAQDQQMQFSKQATADLEEMFAAAAADGITLVFGSGYRSEALQRQFYDSYVSQSGQAAADRFSARPGTSEHQTGLSFDATNVSQACHLEICFEDQPEGKWLRENAYKYGFIIRYPQGKEAVTGYDYEPWHMRWVGKELAAELHKTGVQTLEEFFGLGPAPDYLN